MDFAAACSEHPLATQATGEVLGELLEQLDGPPDLAVLFVTGPHRGVLEDIAATVRELLRPGCLVGATAVSVVAGRHELEEVPAISIWAGRTGPVTARHLDVVDTGDSHALVGIEDDELATAGTALLLADPGFPTDAVLGALQDSHPDLVVAGGVASAGVGPGANFLVLDDRLHDRGAVVVLLGADLPVEVVVSQGCSPIGQPLTVTRAERNMLLELAGRPALDRLQETLAALDEGVRASAAQGLHLGRVVDEHELDFGMGDFLVRNVLGADPSNGAVAVGDLVEVGSTVQFQVRDAASADLELRHLMDEHEGQSALVFTCNGRGMRLFGEPDHDASVVTESLGTAAVAGMFCAGEVGPVGGRSFLHGFTAVTVIFRSPPSLRFPG
ncbi:MAG TPA: FIST N-terminal domain-containing protein [Acidimicrobiales bacterium]